MRDTAAKILKIEQDESKNHPVHTVWFEDWGYAQKVLVSNEELLILQQEDKMLREGIDKKLIEKHRRLVVNQVIAEYNKEYI